MSKKEQDRRAVQMLNSGIVDDWEDFEDYCEEHGLVNRNKRVKVKEQKRSKHEEDEKNFKFS